jgi:GTP-binding protein
MARLNSNLESVNPLSESLRDSKILPILAIVGRPNVGKSTLFNRLAGAKKAIVDDLPGVTRDRNYGEAEWYGKRFLLIDTGGFEPDPKTELKKQIQEQSRLAIEEADAILFLFDGKEGLNPLDRDAVELLREVKKPLFFAVNKIDGQPKETLLYEFYRLGLNEIFPLSAEHGLGLSELMDRLVVALADGREEEEISEERDRPLRLAVVGRPNVGKSTLVNRLLGYRRSVVDAAPGTTRDSVDSPLSWGGDQYVLVDTAGIRRKARIVDRVERYSVVRALGSVNRGDLVVYLLDGTEGVTSQDAQILAYAFRCGKGIILAVNKWDLIPKDQRDNQGLSATLCHKLPFLDFAPHLFISSFTGYGIQKMMQSVRQVALAYQRRIRTSVLNQVLQRIVKGHAAPSYRGREVKFYYGTQTAICPPTFTLFVNDPKGVTSSYERYLVHQLRSALELEHTPIRLVLRGRRNEGLKGSRVKGKRRKK